MGLYPLRVLSIDPGTFHMGIAVIDFPLDKKPTVLMACTEHYVKGNLPLSYIESIHGARFNRLLYMGYKLQDSLEEYQPNVVVAESNYLAHSITAYGALVETLHHLKTVLLLHTTSIPLDTINPTIVKQFMGLTRDQFKDKKNMTNALGALKLKYPPPITLDQFDEHTVDAVCIGLAHYNRISP